MGSPTDEIRLIEFGKQIRERRKALRISVRKLAEDCAISPSYLSAIESGKNSTTHRPPEPSIYVVERLTDVLGLSNTVFNSRNNPCGTDSCHNHALLYRLDDGNAELKDLLNITFGTQVDQWVCISDPRKIQESSDDMISWHWPFGSFPYPDNFLVADRIGDALESHVAAIKEKITTKNYGVVIADCSAVMRWMINPEAEIDYEDSWAKRSTEIFERALGQEPIVNVCVYSHRDIEALSKQIDVLDTILKLFSAHSQTFATSHTGNILSGHTAVTAILADSRPGNISSSAWRNLCEAAATTYTGSVRENSSAL